MAKHGVWKSGYIRVNGVDLSDHASEIRFALSAAEVPSHAMGDDYEFNKPGLFRVTCTARFFQDFAAGSVDATIHPLWANRSEFGLLLRADNGAVSATNPSYSGLAFVSNWGPIGGAHGDNLMAEVTFSPAGNWTRLTA